MNLSASTDTIAAVATASGKGGIGVVRISGPQASHIARAICSKSLIPRTATYCNFLANDGSVIDSGIALFFKAPHSFTGEDVLELQCHGGPVIVQMLLAQTLKNGVRVNYFEKGVRVENGELRLARPGEFTQRAYLNDKLDLAQAEAVADLIDAQTEQAARLAARSLQGEFSREINKLVQQVIDLRMLVEATLDFPEEEIDFLEAANARGKLAIIIEQLTTILRQAQQGALLRNGLNVVLAGAPNVGKSSLLNALAGQDVAIVTPIAGTTRDKVVQAIQIEGIALNVIDTAGLRETSDTVERIGIDRTWQEVERADLVLHLSAFASEPLAMQEDQLLLTQIMARLNQVQARHVPVLEVINKIDLATKGNQLNETPHKPFVAVSAKDRIGLDQLREQILKAVGWQGSGDSVYLARERQLSALKSALGHTQLAQEHAQHSNQFLDLMAEELRLAQNELSTITGEFSPDDLLGEIFSRFCIGK